MYEYSALVILVRGTCGHVQHSWTSTLPTSKPSACLLDLVWYLEGKLVGQQRMNLRSCVYFFVHRANIWIVDEG